MKSPRSVKPRFRWGLRLFIALITSAFLFGNPGSMEAKPVNKKGKPFPDVKLDKVAAGADIVTALGQNVPSIADWYGMTQDQFTSITKRQKSMRADKQGFLHNICGKLPPATLPLDGGTSNDPPTAPYPESQTFYLHSRPGCTKVIYLDFTGHTTSGTQWNTTYAAGANIVTPAYDVDGNLNTFSSAERANIQLIWQRVAEDFSTFEVDVTTEDPGVDGLQKTSPTDNSFGKRVCIGGSCSDWLGQSAGGVAYLGCFDWDIDTPVFVFPAQLGNGNPRYVAEAASHEAGHAFGLNHQGTSAGQEYYQGTTDWAPIMGVGYYSNIVQWSKGEYSGADNTEDAMAMIASYVPLRADNAGNTMGTATVLTGTNPSVKGIIENSADVDVYKFTTGAGAIALNMTPVAPSANIFSRVTLYDGAGTALTTATPNSTITGSIALNATVAQGTYYVAINSTSFADPLTTGFSTYGSVGQYSLAASLSAAPPVAPVANAKNSTPLKGPVPLAVNFSSNGSYDSDGVISGYNWNFGNGNTSTASSPAYTYLNTGSYTASLAVTDNSGLSSTDTVPVYVCAANAVEVYAITMTTAFASGSYTAKATITVKDAKGNLKSGATVKGNWSGAYSRTNVSATTGTTGTCVLTSGSISTRGTFTFTVTGITLTSFVYDPLMNTVTSASILPPVNEASVSAITLSSAFASGAFTAKATITVVNPLTGSPISGALVKGNWSGATSATGVSATTGTNGTCVLTSAATATRGTFTFTVTGITLTGYTYVPAKNTVSTGSILPPPNEANVSAITMSTAFASGTYTSKAIINVKNLSGAPVSGAVVKGNWTGATSATGVTATTDTSGNCVLTSAATATPGQFTFTVTGITLAGFAYDPAKNVITSNSITPPPNEVNVYAIAMTTLLKSGKYYSTATITVKDLSGNLKSGAVVKGNWSGVVSATGVTATTGTTGTCAFTSASTATKGTFTFTVSGITLTSFTYDPAKNVLTSKSITPP